MSEANTTGTPKNQTQGGTVLTDGANPTATTPATTPPAQAAANANPANGNVPNASDATPPAATTVPPSTANGNDPLKTNQPPATILTQTQKVVPEKYDLKMPEGSALPESVLNHITEQAKAKGMSNEEAQAEVNRENEAVSRYTGELMKKVTEQKTAWVQEVHKDPEIGGNNYQAAITNAQRALNAHGTPELVQELNRTGYGNNKEIIRLLARVGSKMADDKAVMPGASGGAAKKSALEVLYDNPNK